MTTTVAWKELDGSPKETWGKDGFSATREFLCPWADRETLAMDMMGDGLNFGNRSRMHYPGHVEAVVFQVQSERFGKQQAQTLTDPEVDLSAYDDWAKLIIQYSPLTDAAGESPTPSEDGTILEYSTSGAAEHITLSPNGSLWDRNGAAPVPDGAAPVKRIPIIDHRISWHLVVDPPWSAMRSQLGTVNSVAFNGFEAETMLFDSYMASKEFAIAFDFAAPQLFWKIDYVFKSKRFVANLGKDDGGAALGEAVAGWQFLWRGTPAAQAGWDELRDVNNKKIYETSDLSGLFYYAGVTP